MSRSTAQQVAHWARIGRALEESAGLSPARIEEVLAGRSRYDELPEREQAVVRSAWDEGIEEARESLDLAERFSRSGRPWAELDRDGKVVVRRPPAEAPASEIHEG